MARVAITAAMIRMVFRFSPATPMSIIHAKVNKELVAMVESLGVNAVGISGKDLVCAAFFCLMQGVTLASAFHPAALPIDRLTFGGMGLVFCVMGNFMPTRLCEPPGHQPELFG